MGSAAFSKTSVPVHRPHSRISPSSHACLMAVSAALPDARRIRSYIFRLPLATRGILALITGFYIAHLFAPGLTQWGALIPQEINFGTCT